MAGVLLAIGVLILAACGTSMSTSPAPELVVETTPGFIHIDAAEPDEQLLELARNLVKSSNTVIVAADPNNPDTLERAKETRHPILPETESARELLSKWDADDSSKKSKTLTIAHVESPALVVFGQDPSAAEKHLLDLVGADSIVSTADPRVDAELAEAINEHKRVVIVGNSRYEAEVVFHQAKVVGDQYLLLDNQHFAAMYGHPAGPALGVLGEQSPKKTVERVKQLVNKYEKSAPGVRFQPSFEIIATIATAGPGKYKDYSGRTPISELRPLVDIAKEEGITVILDLQPGRASMLEQAKYYEELLLEPHVGLALDPEWKLAKDGKHLVRIGHVTAKQVNEVSEWLATLTRENVLPQKMFVLHQFQTQMIRDRKKVNTGHPELATVIHVDGQGPTGAKMSTWNHIRKNPPPNVAWGWKNFVDEDVPMLTTTETWQQVKPHPALITYQ